MLKIEPSSFIRSIYTTSFFAIIIKLCSFSGLVIFFIYTFFMKKSNQDSTYSKRHVVHYKVESGLSLCGYSNVKKSTKVKAKITCNLCQKRLEKVDDISILSVEELKEKFVI